MSNERKPTILVHAKEGAVLPHYATAGASGADVRAHLDEARILPPRQHALIPTGLHASCPEGWEIQVRPRSGLALREGVTVLNTPGTIDADYRGEIGVILINLSERAFTVEPGMRIAQLVCCPVAQASWVLVEGEALETTARAAGGFGHTGRH